MTADGNGGPLTIFDRGAESAGTLGSDAGTVILDAASASRVTVPFDALLLTAQYARDGDDLVLTGEGGETVIVKGYFATGTPPTLVTELGAQVDPALAYRLANAEPLEQYAQAAGGAARKVIGEVTRIEGTVTANHKGGGTDTLTKGAKVYEGDEIVTAADGKILITFTDDTRFGMGTNARMTLDNLVYNPGGSSSMGVSLLQGAFTFVSGKVAKTGADNMKVVTPVGTLGIRGTEGGFFIGIVGQASTIWITSGAAFLSNVAGGALITPGTSVQLSSASDAPTLQPIDQNQIDTLLGGAYRADAGPAGNVAGIEPAAGPTTAVQAVAQAADAGTITTEGGEVAGEGFGETEEVSLVEEAPADIGPDTTTENNDQPIGGGGEGPGGPPAPVQQVFNVGSGSQAVAGSAESVNDSLTVVGVADGTNAISVVESEGGGQLQIVITTSTGIEETLTASLFEDLTLDFSGSPGGNSVVIGAVGNSGLDETTITLIGGPGDDVFDASGNTVPIGNTGTFVSMNMSGGGGNDTLIGGSGNDVLNGGEGVDILFGLAGNDTINGGNDSDLVEGGAGADIMDGDAGIDTLAYQGSAAGVTVNLATGTGSGGDAAGDTFVEFENLIGSENGDTLTGSNLVNIIDGGGGDDTIDGGAGSDVLIGGTGADSILGGADNDILWGLSEGDVLNGGDGVDTADYTGSDAGVTVALGTAGNTGGHAEGDELIAVEAVTGSAFADNLTGDANANLLFGAAGADTINGGGGADNLLGGLDNDTVNGDGGDDQIFYAVGEGLDTVDGGADSDTATVSGIVDAPNVFLIEDGATYNARVGAAAIDADHIAISVNGTLALNIDNVEDLVINAGDAGDTLTVSGNFDGTDLDATTITFNGGAGADTLDTSGLSSDHTVVANNVETIIDNGPPVAQDDAVTTDEDSVLNGDVLADNGNGPDSDPNADDLTVTEVNGEVGDVGTQITLGSGALLTLNADGTFSYDPNGQFEDLAAEAETTDSFEYTLSDGQETDTATVTVTITGVNDAPETDDANAAGVEDAASIPVTLTGSDVDGTVASFTLSSLPSDGTLFVDAALETQAETGTPYAAASNALTLFFVPDDDFNGEVTFQFAAIDNDGLADATPATATITVAAVNDAPTLSEIDNLAGLEDAANPITFAALLAASNADDVDGTVTGFRVEVVSSGTLTVDGAPAVPGSSIIDAAANVVWTPDADVNGIQPAFTIVAIDDQDAPSTTPVQVNLNLTPVNDAPSFTIGADQDVLEDAGAVTVEDFATNISAGPADENGQALTFNISTDNNDLFAVGPSIDAETGDLTYTLAENANGAATVTVSLSDDGGTDNGGVDTSGDQTFTITVAPVNDAPSFTIGDGPEVGEDAGPVTVAGFATAISAGPADEAGQELTFNVSTDNGGLFAVGPSIDAETGDLTFEAAADANGVANVTVSLMDDGGTLNGGVDTSADQIFTITVNSENDAPTLTTFGNLSGFEDQPTLVTFDDLIGAGDEADIDGEVTGFLIQGVSSGVLTLEGGGPITIGVTVIDAETNVVWTPAADVNGVQPAFSVVAVDNEGANSAPAVEVSVNLTAVNDAPSFTIGDSPEVGEDAGPVTVAGFATDISAGPADEAGQELTFNISTDNGGLFAVGPSIDAETGDLTFETATDANGVANVTVSLMDDGGELNGGVDTSADQIFTITVNAVNDPAVIAGDTTGDVTEDAEPNTATGQLTASDPDNPDNTFIAVPAGTPSDQLYGTFSMTAGGAWTYVLDNTNGTVNGLAEGAQLVDSFTVQSIDGTSQNIGITITGANDAPVVTTSGVTQVYDEGDDALVIEPALVLTDVDSPDLVSATVSISGGFIPDGGDVLGVTGAGDIVGSYNSTTGVLTLTGVGTVAEYQAVLRTVTFSNTTENVNGDDRTISWQVNDGSDPSLVATTTVEVVPDGTYAVTGSGGNDIFGVEYGSVIVTVQPADETFTFDDPDLVILDGNGGDADVVIFEAPVDGADFLIEGDNTETLVSLTQNDAQVSVRDFDAIIINGSDNADTIDASQSSADNLTFIGGGGDDTITGGSGDELIIYVGDAGFDVIDGGDGTDQLTVNDDDANTGGPNIALMETGAAYNERNELTEGQPGSFESSHIVISFQDEVFTPAMDVDGVENVFFQAGNEGDTLIVNGDFGDTDLAEQTITVNGGIGNDTFDGSGITSAHRLVASGNAGNDTILGGAADDDLDGGTGEDVIDGGAGDDFINVGDNGSNEVPAPDGDADRVIYRRGDGVDTVEFFDPTNDVVELQNTGLTNFGELSLSDGGTGNTTLDLGGGSQMIFLGVQATDLTAANFDFQVVAPTNSDDVLFGTPGVDTIDGLGGNDTIDGLGDYDLLIGGDGNDTLLSGGAPMDPINVFNGFDILEGGDGDDTLIAQGGLVIIRPGAGNDTIIDQTTGSIYDFTYVDYGTSPQVIINLTDQTQLGVAAGRVDDGFGGIDILVETPGVSQGPHVVADSNGDDMIFVDETYLSSFGNWIEVRLSGGDDQVVFDNVASARISYQFLAVQAGDPGVRIDLDPDSNLATNVATGVGIGATAALVGNDTITGATQARGSNGDDELFGSDRTDIVERFRGSDGSDMIDGRGGIDQVDHADSPGNVTVDLSQNLVLDDGFGNVDTLANIENAVGNFGDDHLSGDSLANVLVGLAGDDTLIGNDGNDSLIGDGGIGGDIGAPAGNDTLDGGAGNDYLEGGGGDDTIDGGDDNDFIRPLDGDDNVDGGAGFDTISYALGSTDGIIYTGNGDAGETATVVRNGGVGDDSIGTDSLASIERIEGTPFDDVFNGDQFPRTYSPLGGADIVNGGIAFDFIEYVGLTPGAGNAGITVTFTSIGAGTVTEPDGTVDSFTGIDGVVGTAGNDVIGPDDGLNTFDGWDGDDLIFGGDARDLLVGGLGADTIDGGIGNDDIWLGRHDSFAVDSDVDRVVFQEGYENDTAFNFNVANDIIVLRNTGFTDISQLNLTDDDLDTILTLNDGSTLRLVGVDDPGLLTNANFEFDNSGLTVIEGDFNAGNDEPDDNFDVTFGSLFVVRTPPGDTFTLDDPTVVTINGLTGNDTITFSAPQGESNFTLTDVNSDLHVTTGSHPTTVIVQNIETIIVNGQNSADTIDASGTDKDLQLNGSNGPDVIIGGGGNDTITGGLGSDTLTGGDGDDTLQGGGANDDLLGGDGFDTAVFSGNFADYALSFDGSGGLTVTGNDGTDTLAEIEQLQFDDATVGVVAGAASPDDFNVEFGSVIVTVGADTYTFNDADPVIIDGGDGVDEVTFAAAPSGVLEISQNGDDNLVVTTTAGDQADVVLSSMDALTLNGTTILETPGTVHVGGATPGSGITSWLLSDNTASGIALGVGLTGTDQVTLDIDNATVTIADATGTFPVLSVGGSSNNVSADGNGVLNISGSDAAITFMTGGNQAPPAGDPVNTGVLLVGRNGTGAMTVSDGAQVSGAQVGLIGRGLTGTEGTLTITGTNSTVRFDGEQGGNGAFLGVGSIDGTGTVNIEAGGTLIVSSGLTEKTFPSVFIGDNTTPSGDGTSSSGTVNVDGAGSQLLVQGNTPSLAVGRDGGEGTLNVDNGGYVESLFLNVGLHSGTGTMNLTDSELLLTGIGGPGAGSDEGQGAFLSVGRGALAGQDAADGTLNISGSNVTITSGGDDPINGPGMQVGGSFSIAGGTGTITIDEGSLVQIIGDGTATTRIHAGSNFGTGTINVLGGSSVEMQGAETTILIGRDEGTGTLNVAEGSEVSGMFLNVGLRGGTGTMVLGIDDDVANASDGGDVVLSGVAGVGTDDDGQGAFMSIGRGISTAGTPGIGEVTLVDGSTITIDSGNDVLASNIGPGFLVGGSSFFNDGVGTMTVDGSTVSVTGDFARFHVGRDLGTGTLNVVNGGTIDLSDPVGADNARGLVGQDVGSSGTVFVNGGTSLIDAGNLLRIGHGDETAALSGTVTVQDDATIQATDVNVVAGGLLKGNDGNINGRLNIAGGTVAPGASIGAMAVAGAFLMSAGVLEVEINGTDSGNTLTGDVLAVTGDATIDHGTLHLIFSGDAPAIESGHVFLTATDGVTVQDGEILLDTIAVAVTGIDTSDIDSDITDFFAITPFGGGQQISFIAAEGLTASADADATVLFGSNQGDFFDGGPGDDVLLGGPGNDVLKGGAGNDTLGGGPGNDILIGGPGSDTVGYGTSPSGVQVNLTGGDITITTGPFGSRPYIWAPEGFAADGFGGFDSLFTVENVIGSPSDDVILGNNLDNDLRGNTGNDLLMGNPGADTILGGAGNDRLFGGEGDDTTSGNAGNDTFYVFAGDGDDVITDFTPGAATPDIIWLIDPIISDFAGLLTAATDDGTHTTIALSDGGTLTLENVLEAQLHQDDFVFASAGPGTIGSDVLIGTAGDDNPLNGLAGNDLIFGAGGNDFIFGGDGDDILLGGPDALGNSFVGGAGNDIIDGGVGIGSFNGVIYAGEGGGSGVSVDLGLGIATDTFGDTDILKNISTVRGTILQDTLFGGSRDGFEDFRPLGGDDTVDGRGGVDRITYSDAEFYGGLGGATVDLGAGTATDPFGDSDTLSNIEFVRGTNQVDTLTGGDTATGLNPDLFIFGRLGTPFERFEGIGGNDTINGGAGLDMIAYHNDQLFGGSTGVNLTFTGGGAGAGTDTNSDTDSFTGIEGVIGSVFNDTFNGSGADEYFQGMAGSDTVNGGGGVDTVSYYFEAYIPDNLGAWGSAGVTVDLSAAGGNATDSYGTTDTLSGIENVIGTIFNDTITGDANNNLLDGADGADVLTGGGGADIFAYRLASDGAAIASNTTHGVAGADTLTDFLSGTDRIVLDFDAFGLSEGALVDGTNFEIIGSEYDGTNATSSEFAAGNASVVRDSTGALIYDGNGAAEGYTVLIDSGAGTVQASDIHSQQTV